MSRAWDEDKIWVQHNLRDIDRELPLLTYRDSNNGRGYLLGSYYSMWYAAMSSNANTGTNSEAHKVWK